MKIKKYRFVYFDRSLEEYCFGNRLPKHMNKEHTDRYDATFFFNLHNPRDMHKLGDSYTNSELTILMYKRFQKIYRKALKERHRLRVEIGSNQKLDYIHRMNERTILKSRKHLTIWTKKVRKVKGSKEYVFETLMK